QLIVGQQLWIEGCGGTTEGAARCRGDVLQFAVELAFTGSFSPESAVGARLRAAFAAAWATHFPGGLSVATANIPNRNPLVNANGPGSTVPGLGVGVGDSAALNPADRELLTRLARDAALPAVEEPLTPRREPLEVLRLNAWD